MGALSLNQLQELTGKGYRTIKRALDAAGLQGSEVGRALKYESAPALEAIYTGAEARVYDLQTERARLAFHQANLEALNEAERRGELVQTRAVYETLVGVFSFARTRIQGIPPRLLTLAYGGADRHQTSDFLNEEIHRLLTEVADGMSQLADGIEVGGDILESAAEDDGVAVGGE